MNANFTRHDLNEMLKAKGLLENPALTAKIANLIGMPLEKGFKLLPVGWREKVAETTRAALLKGLDLAVSTLGDDRQQKSKDRLHRFMVAASGAGGGAFGLPALPIELPISTGLILRSIADIARSEGHDLTRLDIRLSCLEVLALGGITGRDNAAENGYWAVRTFMARTITEAASYIAERGFAEEGAPPLARLVIAVASRFSAVVSEEAAAKAIPAVGAFMGAAINVLFMDHFQNMARGHFIIKRLENTYGSNVVRMKYAGIAI
jgi:hypothetical protein